jgi:hypothetical protein
MFHRQEATTMSTRKNKEVLPITVALNQVRGPLWRRIPIKDGSVFNPTFDPPELLEELAPWEREPFERRMRMLVSMARNILAQHKSEEDIEQAIREAEIRLLSDGTDIHKPV